ncbi:ABC transporter permease [Pigmentiphaga sp. YJ18]|uniref:ABC transporter permease n=1 Tax=Pigmentiphaga sp. YJ18 TaxID=3134907 RepID=UPI0040540E59
MPDLFPETRSAGGVFGFVRRHPTMVIGGLLLLLMILVAVFAPWLAARDPASVAPALRKMEPSARFWFGTDILGRDLYSRVLFGARVSLVVGFAVALLSCLIGLAIGLVSGYVRWADNIVMRVMDGMMSIPPILLAIALMALTRASIGNVILAITVTEIPRVARVVRGIVISLREQPFVEAAIASGTRAPTIMVRHILPNVMGPLIVQATFICASAILIEAALSFLGAGTPSNIPSWGNIMAEGRSIWQVKPYIVFFPALFLSVTVLAMNMLGDGVRDLLDPRMNEHV